MKKTALFVGVAALWLGCSGLAAAQCAGQRQFAGFDLLQTTGGTQDDLTSIGLTDTNNQPNPLTFTGVPLPHAEIGTSDTIVCRIDSLPNPFQNPASVGIQIVALYLKADATYTPPQSAPVPVTVYATINQTQDAQGNYAICPAVSPDPQSPCHDSSKVLPEPTPSPGPYPNPSNGQMTVFPGATGGTFDTNFLNIQADLIIVDRGAPVTANPIAVLAMPLDTINSSGSTWTTAPPDGYPNSSTFSSGGFYVNDPNGGFGSLVPLLTTRIFRVSLYGLGLLLAGIAVVRIRSGIKGGRLTLRPVYMMGLAAIAWFLGWKSSKLVFPTIAHANAITTCVPHTISAFVNEGNGNFVVHKIVTAVCTTISSSTTASASL